MTPASPIDLVARNDELRAATGALAGGRGMLVTGAHGAGRTAFAAAVAGTAERRGDTPLWVVATASLSTVPFGPFGWLLGEVDAPAVAALGRITSALRRHGGSSRTVLVIDDVHLLDDRSADAVLQAVVSGAAAVVATAAEGARLPQSIARLVDDRFVVAIELGSLGREDVDAVAAGLLGGPVAFATTELLWRWSDGMPGLLQAIVVGGREAGRFRPIAGRWWWVGPELVPDELVGRVDRMLAAADPAVGAALDVVALAEPIELDLVGPLVGDGALAELERLGLVTTERRDGSIMVHCRTAIVGAQRLAAMTTLRRRCAARRLLGGVPPRPSPVDLVRRAVWHLDGDVPATADVLLAASSVVRLTDPALAQRLTDTNRRWNADVRALLDVVANHVEAGLPAEARGVLEHTRRIARTNDDVALVEAADVAVRLFAERQPSAARRTVAAARARRGAVPDDPDLRSLDALAAFHEARPDAALEHARLVLSMPTAGPPARLRAGLIHAVYHLLSGQTTEALSSADKLMATAVENVASMPTMVGSLRAVVAFAQLWRGGSPTIPSAHPGTARWPSPPFLPPSAGAADQVPFTWPLMAGIVAHLKGDHDVAVPRLRDAVVQQRGGKGLFHAEATAWLTVALCDAGAPGEGAAALAEFPQRYLAILPGLEGWARGVLACARRDPSRGAEFLHAAADEARAVGARLVEARYLIELADRCGDEAPIDRLDDLATSLDAPLLQCLCRVAVARLKDDPDALVDGAQELADLGLDARAIAVAAVAARGARAENDEATARRAAATVRRIRTVANGHTASRSGGRNPGLTRREAEAAVLAAGGLSDREIAARLIVSIRTVESHLASSYRKLGVGSRAALGGALADLA